VLFARAAEHASKVQKRAPGSEIAAAAGKVQVEARKARCTALAAGLTLVHFSAQPEPFLSLQSAKHTQRVPKEMLPSRQMVHECTPLTGGRHRGVADAAEGAAHGPCGRVSARQGGY